MAVGCVLSGYDALLQAGSAMVAHREQPLVGDKNEHTNANPKATQVSSKFEDMHGALKETRLQHLKAKVTKR